MVKETTYADRTPIEERLEALKFVFNKDLSFISFEKIKTCLDLGCGRGALGMILRSKNPNIQLTGVDTQKSSPAAQIGYSHFYQQDAFEFLKQIQQESGNNQKFDLIISCGLPPEIVERIIKEIDPDTILAPGGYMVLMVDSPLTLPPGSKFEIREGSYPINHNIGFFRKKN